MGGDEFAAYLVESRRGGRRRGFVARLNDRVDELIATGSCRCGLASARGVAHFPDEAADADALFRLADQRLYECEARQARA